jgi:hypothetical protein
MILLDTDHLTILVDQRNAGHADLATRLAASHDLHAVPEFVWRSNAGAG